jgi:hypothetical protein
MHISVTRSQEVWGLAASWYKFTRVERRGDAGRETHIHVGEVPRPISGQTDAFLYNCNMFQNPLGSFVGASKHMQVTRYPVVQCSAEYGSGPRKRTFFLNTHEEQTTANEKNAGSSALNPPPTSGGERRHRQGIPLSSYLAYLEAPWPGPDFPR